MEWHALTTSSLGSREASTSSSSTALVLLMASSCHMAKEEAEKQADMLCSCASMDDTAFKV